MFCFQSKMINTKKTSFMMLFMEIFTTFKNSKQALFSNTNFGKPCRTSYNIISVGNQNLPLAPKQPI